MTDQHVWSESIFAKLHHLLSIHVKVDLANAPHVMNHLFSATSSILPYTSTLQSDLMSNATHLIYLNNSDRIYQVLSSVSAFKTLKRVKLTLPSSLLAETSI